ncbi:MAG: 1,4-dihydroxy-2-naphthoate octaprenyltransferase [Propionibacteriaceae bacterium]|nr:1,4-dihydroxy-2-naphthoate octaprenyltransferase [Propionibacteriaceae bacterium]
MATAREWLEGARLRTLSVSTAPVLAGTGVAWSVTGAEPPYASGWASFAVSLVPFVLCLLVGLALQVGGNFSNDYSDGVRGTDTHRVGPMRLVGSGAAPPGAVKRAAWISFALAGVIGLILASMAAGLLQVHAPGAPRVPVSVLTFVLVILVGAACVVAAWFYTGGAKPYGYMGLGEVFVFIFFGVVATVGTVVVQSPPVCASDATGAGIACPRQIAWGPTLVAAVVMGCFAMAVLVANNLRDLDTDARAGKITLPVRLGDRRTRVFYAILIAVSVVGLVVISWWTTWFALVSLLGAAMVLPSLVRVMRGATGRDLIHVLKWTGLSELATAVLLAVGLGIGWFHG